MTKHTTSNLRSFARIRAFTLVLALASSFALTTLATAQQSLSGIGTGLSMDVERIPAFVRDDPGRLDERVWTVKFVCGEISPQGSPERGFPLAPGSYRTDINIFNGQIFQPAKFDLVIALANAPDEPRGEVLFITGGIVLEKLSAVQVDCAFIRSKFNKTLPAFIKGFVQLEVATERRGRSTLIEVVAVYTAKNVEIAPVIGDPPFPNK